MSKTEHDIDERLWERYLLELRDLSENGKYKLHPSISDYHVWLSDQDLDTEEHYEG